MNRAVSVLEILSERLQSFANKIYLKCSKSFIRKNRKESSNIRRYVVMVPLAKIKKFIPNKMLESVFYPNRVHFSTIPSFVWGGSWDKKALLIDKYYASYSKSYKSVFQMLRNKIHYSETDEYKDKLRTIQQNGSTARGDTIDELNQYFDNLLTLADSIANEGYKLQEDLGGNIYDEIGVFIGRNGELIKAEDKFCGTHRFAIAKYLNLKTVPVCILAAHQEWADKNKILLENSNKLELYFKSINA